jgi:hypothetical protein
MTSVRMYVCMYERTYVRAIPSTWSTGRILFMSDIQGFISHKSESVNMNTVTPKLRALQIGLEKQNDDFLLKLAPRMLIKLKRI